MINHLLFKAKIISGTKINHHSKSEIVAIFFPQGSVREKVILSGSFKLYFNCCHLYSSELESHQFTLGCTVHRFTLPVFIER